MSSTKEMKVVVKGFEKRGVVKGNPSFTSDSQELARSERKDERQAESGSNLSSGGNLEQWLDDILS